MTIDSVYTHYLRRCHLHNCTFLLIVHPKSHTHICIYIYPCISTPMRSALDAWRLHLHALHKDGDRGAGDAGVWPRPHGALQTRHRSGGRPAGEPQRDVGIKHGTFMYISESMIHIKHITCSERMSHMMLYVSKWIIQNWMTSDGIFKDYSSKLEFLQAPAKDDAVPWSHNVCVCVFCGEVELGAHGSQKHGKSQKTMQKTMRVHEANMTTA